MFRAQPEVRCRQKRCAADPRADECEGSIARRVVDKCLVTILVRGISADVVHRAKRLRLVVRRLKFERKDSAGTEANNRAVPGRSGGRHTLDGRVRAGRARSRRLSSGRDLRVHGRRSFTGAVGYHDGRFAPLANDRRRSDLRVRKTVLTAAKRRAFQIQIPSVRTRSSPWQHGGNSAPNSPGRRRRSRSVHREHRRRGREVPETHVLVGALEVSDTNQFCEGGSFARFDGQVPGPSCDAIASSFVGTGEGKVRFRRSEQTRPSSVAGMRTAVGLFLLSLAACSGSSGAAECVAAGGQCVLGGHQCGNPGPQDCNPDRNPGGAFCCLLRTGRPAWDGET